MAKTFEFMELFIFVVAKKIRDSLSFLIKNVAV